MVTLAISVDEGPGGDDGGGLDDEGDEGAGGGCVVEEACTVDFVDLLDPDVDLALSAAVFDDSATTSGAFSFFSSTALDLPSLVLSPFSFSVASFTHFFSLRRNVEEWRSLDCTSAAIGCRDPVTFVIGREAKDERVEVVGRFDSRLV